MKRTIFCAFLALALTRCGNALDGNPHTDTTNVSPDTGGANLMHDTASQVVTKTGEYPNDTIAQHNLKGDVRSSSPSNTSDRSTTPGNDSLRQRQ